MHVFMLQVSLRNLDFLTTLTGLSCVRFSNVRVYGPSNKRISMDLACLQPLTALEDLSLLCASVTLASWRHAFAHPTLRRLRLELPYSYPKLERALAKGVSVMSTRIERLAVETGSIKVSALATRAPLPHLTSLSFFPGSLKAGCLDAMSQLTGLQELELVLGKVTDPSGLVGLTALTALTSLNVNLLHWLSFSVVAQVRAVLPCCVGVWPPALCSRALL